MKSGQTSDENKDLKKFQNEVLDLTKYFVSAKRMRQLISRRLLLEMKIPEEKKREHHRVRQKLHQKKLHDELNAISEYKFYKKLNNEIVRIGQEKKLLDKEKSNDHSSDRLKSKFDIGRGWVDDVLSLCTDGFRLQNQDLITGSTYFSGANSLWDIYKVYTNPQIGHQRHTRLCIDSLKFITMVLTIAIKKSIEVTPTVATILTSIAVLNFLLDLYKSAYIILQLNQQLEVESKMIDENKDEIKLVRAANRDEIAVVGEYERQFNLYHEKNKNELKIAIFRHKRALCFAAIGFIGAVMMPGGFWVWGVACTGSRIIAGATFFEFIDRRFANYYFTEKIAVIPERTQQAVASSTRYAINALQEAGKTGSNLVRSGSCAVLSAGEAAVGHLRRREVHSRISQTHVTLHSANNGYGKQLSENRAASVTEPRPVGSG